MNISIRQRLLAVLMAALLATSLVPSWAFANDDSQVKQQENSAEQVDESSLAPSSSSPGENVASGESAAGVSGAADMGFSAGASEGGGEGGGAGESAAGGAVAGATVAAGGALAPAAGELGGAASAQPLGAAAEPGATPAGAVGAAEAGESQITVSVSVSGPDASGASSYWANQSLVVEKGCKASSAFERALQAADLKATIFGEGENWYLSSIKTPYEPSVDLGWDEASGRFWQFFVNGESSWFGAGQVTLADGDSIALSYSAFGEAAPGWVSASCEVIGVDASGNRQVWASETALVLKEGATAAALSEKLYATAGLTAAYSAGEGGWYLASITSPFDSSRTLTWNSSTGEYWQLFINGEYAKVGPGAYTIETGDSIAWVYGSDGLMPDESREVVVDPSASRPDWEAEWAGDAPRPSSAPTPVDYLKDAWVLDYSAYSSGMFANASEPIIVNGFVYLAVDNRLLKIDASTGEVLKSAFLKQSVGYTARPVYAQGVVIVPLDGGAVQALTADELVTVWVTDPVGDLAQSNSALTIDDGFVYVGTVDVSYAPDWTALFSNGHLLKIEIATGKVKWEFVNSNEGYYWGGAAVVGDFVVVATSAGTVEVLDRQQGSRIGLCSLGSSVNSACVASADGSTVYVVSRDGSLHVLALGADGSLSESRVVPLGFTGSACMATLCGEALFVGGEIGDGSGLAIVDLGTFGVQLISSADGEALPKGGIKGAPLVSVQAGGMYVYFTVNYGETADWSTYTSGGGVYRYRVGDAEAELVYDAAGHNNYCDSPVVCDKDGNLYYINDSYTLFKLVGGGVKPGQNSGEANDGEDTEGTGEGGSGSGGGSTPSGSGAGAVGSAGVAGDTVAPSSVPVAAGAAAGEASESAEAGAEAKAGAAADEASQLSLGSAADGARSVAGADDAGERNASTWPYVVLGIGVVAAVAAIAWFIAASRRRGSGVE